MKKSPERPDALTTLIRMATVVLSLMSTAWPSEIDPECRDRFLSEAPTAWKQVNDRLAPLAVDGIQKHHSGVETVPDSENKFTIELRSEPISSLVQVIRTHEDKPYVERYVKNDKYCFTVARTGDEPWEFIEGHWFISSDDRDAIVPGDGYLVPLETGSRFWSIPGLLVLSDPAYELIEAVEKAPENSEDARTIRVSHMYRGPTERGKVSGATYWREMNPDNYWLADRQGMTFPNGKGNLTANIRYQQTADGVPFPQLTIIRSDTPGSSAFEGMVVEFGPPIETTFSKEEHLLPFYGFSESMLKDYPSFAIAARIRERLYFFIVMNLALLIVIAVLLRRRRKRKQAMGSVQT